MLFRDAHDAGDVHQEPQMKPSQLTTVKSTNVWNQCALL